jgi:D-serine deaminase-like pyridoxal phosphate-dependent protein
MTGRTLDDPDLPTPLAYVDTDVLDRNIAAMAQRARRHGVALRPHIKTHKIAEIARRQLEAGASGLTVAKLGEAEALSAAGIETSFMVAQPYLGAERVRWHLALAQRHEVIAAVDSLEAARGMGAEATRHGSAVDLVVIVDTGYGRLGAQPADAPALAKEIAAVGGVRLRGIRSHSGDAYHVDTHEGRMAITRHDAATIAATGQAIRVAGLGCDIVSVGSTPGLADVDDDIDFTGVTEWRPGNYVFFDRIQLSLGSARLEDCAVRVVTSVVSTPGEGRAVIDAGKKTLTSTKDPYASGHGLVLDQPDVEIHAVSEECGWVSDPAGRLLVGQRLTVIPNHACEISNLTDLVAYGVGGRVDGFWEPTARAKVW